LDAGWSFVTPLTAQAALRIYIDIGRTGQSPPSQARSRACFFLANQTLINIDGSPQFTELPNCSSFETAKTPRPQRYEKNTLCVFTFSTLCR
jgi:hypothetical protein